MEVLCRGAAVTALLVAGVCLSVLCLSMCVCGSEKPAHHGRLNLLRGEAAAILGWIYWQLRTPTLQPPHCHLGAWTQILWGRIFSCL